VLFRSLSKIDTERTGTVVHIGAKGTIGNVCERLNDLSITTNVLMENCAETKKLGRTLDEIRLLVEGTDSKKLGICFDTCHMYSGQMCNLNNANEVESFFEDLTFLHNRKVIFHVNDSLVPYNDRTDRHSPIGYGHIWNMNLSESLGNLERFYELLKQNCYDCIFETPNPYSNKYESELFNKV